MSERDKMLAGELYNCLDTELRAMAVAARRRVAAYCATDPGDEEERWRMLGEIFARVGPGVHIEPPLYVDYGVTLPLARPRSSMSTARSLTTPRSR
jgi:maltose O-acetyltransferase